MAINVVEYDSNWERLAGAEFTMQHSFFNPHDFAITPNNYIFFQVRRSSRFVVWFTCSVFYCVAIPHVCLRNLRLAEDGPGMCSMR